MPPRRHEAGKLLELRDPHRGLHVGSFEIVAYVRVDVLVIEPTRQLTKLPIEPLAAGVFLPGSHQQSLPQSRKLSTSGFNPARLVTTQPPSPMVMWWAG